MMHTKENLPLTSAEMGKLWATYMGNSLAICVLQYFLKNVQDAEIKLILEQALSTSQKYIQVIKDIFVKENYPLPHGFTNEDVNLTAPRLFMDPFYLYYLRYNVKAGISIYATAVPLMARADVSEFFTNCLKETIDLCNLINKTLLAKGLFVRPPYIPVPDQVEFVHKQSYFNGFFGHVRPLHALAITHIYDSMEDNAVSKAKEMGFSQVTKSQKVMKYLLKAKSIATKHLDVFDSLLKADNLPAPMTLDDMVTNSTISPFSDKLMVFHAIESAAIRVRAYGNSLSFNARHDVSIDYVRMLLDIGNLAEDGAHILIDHGWLEQPPAAIDRNTLAKT